jgi:23S rRNA pseudouridine1911/1915/1917 synthase
MSDPLVQQPQNESGAESLEAREVEVSAASAGLRLDAFLAAALPGFSRSRLKSLILAGQVTIGGATVVEPKRPVNSGERIRVGVPAPVAAEPGGEPIPLDIVYEDDALIVIDKPAGLVVHPAAGHWSGTLVNALIAHCGDSLSGINGVRRPGIVHRLDKDTSGLMVVAKTDAAHASLAAQFADHGRTGALERRYHAIVWGAPRLPFGTLEAAIARSTRNRQRMAVVKDEARGKMAVTHYETLRAYGAKKEPVAALIDCRLETGRTHQIRVHMAAMGHPLLGDKEYGAGFRTKSALLSDEAQAALSALGRQALHAYLLRLEHPGTGEILHFERAEPAGMANLMRALSAL